MSTPGGGGRRPSVIKVGAKPAGKPSAKPSAPKVEPDDLDDVDEVSDSADVDAPAAGDEVESPPAKSGRTAGSRTAGARTAGSRTAGARKAGSRAAASKTATPAAAGRGTARTTSSRPGAKPVPRPIGKGSGRKPITAVKVGQGRNWGPIMLFSVVGLLAVGIIGFAGWQVYQNGRTFDQRTSDIPGVVNYRKTNPKLSQAAQHAWGPLTYPQSPPVGGTHNPNWQNCMGDVYDAQIANEHAVHAMEHGAVWVTYNPDKVSKADIETLAKRVRGKEYMLMSPYPNLDKPISVQAWGYQLKLTSAGDGRIDDFIKVMRHSAGIEQGAQCSGGITETGTTPRDLGKDQQQQQGG